jgi:hypothetical protein
VVVAIGDTENAGTCARWEPPDDPRYVRAAKLITLNMSEMKISRCTTSHKVRTVRTTVIYSAVVRILRHVHHKPGNINETIKDSHRTSHRWRRELDTSTKRRSSLKPEVKVCTTNAGEIRGSIERMC